MRSLKTLIAALFIALQPVMAQDADWYNLDPINDGILGVSARRANEMLPDKSVLQPVIVAVIDDGVDIGHTDFEGRIWTNTKEVADNGVDDDGNGYIDDVNGWNFLGNPKGENVEYENVELTRLLRPLSKKFDQVEPDNVSKADKKQYAEYLVYKDAYDLKLQEINEEFAQFAQISALVKGAYTYMQERTGEEELSAVTLMEYTPADDEERQIIEFLLMAEREGISEYLEEANEYFDMSLNYHYNLDYSPRHIVNVDDAAALGTGYGNNMVWAAQPEHGTHVAGIIAAIRGNAVGVDGIASSAVIMPIRAVPGGDERDEDIALAIRYAVDNGARIVNMSFGKAYSPRADMVFEAMEYARSKNVLLVHAAGNDAINNDKTANYPDGSLGKKVSIENWISVGASGPLNDTTVLADFSNFGPKKVDVLAPGVEILSLFPGGGVKSNSGTSMAAPVVSGVAALVLGKYPQLTAAQLKQVLIGSLYYPEDAMAVTASGNVELKKLIRYPGIVNAERALILAESKYGTQTIR